ncbi:MAG: hypothetical protein ACTSSG_03595 [Candidatus Heimdallarchaeaceae archaeon]
MGIITPFISLYYGIVLKMKFKWFSRKKRKGIKVTRAFLRDRLKEGDLEEKTIEKIINNYLRFGETVFNRKTIEGAFSLHKLLDNIKE